MNDFRVYERFPIRIAAHTAIMLTLFKAEPSHWSDIWMWDNSDTQRSHYEIYERAAKQFSAQLEGHDCIAFWQALQAEAARHIEAWEMAKNDRAI